jgi:hypothetical protein
MTPEHPPERLVIEHDNMGEMTVLTVEHDKMYPPGDHCVSRTEYVRADLYEAITAKLPKTADGVVVTPGMKVYRPAHYGPQELDDFYYDEYNGFCAIIQQNAPMMLCPIEHAYSTEAAAREAGGGGG